MIETRGIAVVRQSLQVLQTITCKDASHCSASNLNAHLSFKVSVVYFFVMF